jgi:hypothetical protein
MLEMSALPMSSSRADGFCLRMVGISMRTMGMAPTTTVISTSTSTVSELVGFVTRTANP